MKKLCFLTLNFMIISSLASATIITVDNNYPSIGNYTTLQAAHNAANPGDTIYVFPSNLTYQAINVIKKLTFIGSGYDLSQSTLKTSKMKGILTFYAGSNGSVVEGFDSYSNEFSIVVNANSIIIKKNKLSRTIIRSGHSGVTIQQNFLLYTGQQNYDSYIENSYSIRIDTSNLGIFIQNNKIVNSSFAWPVNGSTVSGGGIFIADSSNVIIWNNTLVLNNTSYCGHPTLPYVIYPSASSDYYIVNNIFSHGQIGGVSDRYYYNMIDCGSLPPENGNQYITDWNIVFIDYYQLNFHLTPGSPAIGSGQGGVDMGIYGGNTPYNDNGYPGIPAIYYLDVPFFGSQQNGVNVTIKAKSNN